MICPEEKSEGFSVERGCPGIDTGCQCVHHELVYAGDVHSLFSMRHSQRAPAFGVPLLQESVLDRIDKIRTGFTC